jgi:hypothetical protein
VTGGTTTVDAASYRTVAAAMGKAGGIDYRYGPAPSAYGTTDNSGVPSWFKRNDNAFVSDRNGGQRPCDPQLACGTWQVGAWSNTVGDFSSNSGHVAFIPDVPAQRVGVADLAISSVSNAVFSQRPELKWVYYGAGLDELNGASYRQGGAAVGNPVGVARCLGRPGWCMNSLMVFDSGFIGSAQTNTSTNKASAQLAAGKVPTAVAVSNSNEFAFITVWDTVNLRGEVAVVALAGLCEGCTPSNPGASDFWGEWRGLYPGLPNLGNTAYMKVLGYIPLPADMKAPTDISVTTGVSRDAYLPAGIPGRESTGDLPLSSATNRATFKSGGRNYNSYAKGGVAVVSSKSEQKVAFLDLRPLFAYYQSMYFGSDSDYSVTTSVGPADSQWPRTFASAPAQTPTVIKTVSMANRPTAVRAYAWGSNRRAWVATQDGQLHIFNLGDYPTAGSGSASSIVEVGAVAVGRNPTGIALVKEKGGNAVYPDITREVIVTSRGDRQLQWVRFAGDGNSGSVVRTLKDTRLVDPIAAEDTDNHGAESYVVSVADYGGRALRNYRYGPVIMHNYGGSACGSANGCGMGSGNNDAFEYGGEFALPGGAFQVTSANIP